jgi:hypothetical protein
MMPKPLIAAARHLVDVLERENAALRTMDLRRTASLLPEKSAAIAELTAFGEASGLPPDPGLGEVVRRLDALALENRRLLDRAIVAQRRVIGIIVRAAITASAGSSYRAPGRPVRSPGPMTLSTRA